MKRPTWVRILAFILAILLTGCAGAPAPTTTEETTPPTSMQQPTEETSFDPTAKPSEEVTSPAVSETAHEHKHSAIETVQPTCTAEGYTTYMCDCGDSYIDDRIEKLEHNYEKTDTVDPTTQSEGYTIYVCRSCFSSKRDDYVPMLESEINTLQRNSINMLNYLATIAERINVSRGNRLMLEDIYDILLNDINPGKIDEETQGHLEDLRYIIYNFIDTSTKRERLEYLHNQDKATAIRNAVPDPLAILSVSNALDWKKLATTVVFTIVDSYNNYASAKDQIDREYLISTWELEDEETDTIRRNSDGYFDYMVDIVQKYGFDGTITLNENAVKRFAEICNNTDLTSKVQSLLSEQQTYEHFANYWLELADCYFLQGKYTECLACIDKYKELSTGIFRKDYEYAQVLPKVIVAAQSTNQSVSVIEGFANDLIANTNKTDKEDWALRYFAAQVYVDLYSKVHQKSYLELAYGIALDNVNELKSEQIALNKIYLEDVKLITLEKPDYSRMNKQQKKEAQAEYNAEKKRVDAYNKALEKTRTTELPPLYEPLIVNCDLLFALASKLNIDKDQKEWIESILMPEGKHIFLSDTIIDRYSFSNQENSYSISYSKDSIEIPANLLTQGATIKVQIKKPTETGGYTTSTFTDWTLGKVKRNSDDVETFTAHYTSSSIKDVEWVVGTEITIHIINGEGYAPVVFQFKVTECKNQFPFGTKVVFEEL